MKNILFIIAVLLSVSFQCMAQVSTDTISGLQKRNVSTDVLQLKGDEQKKYLLEAGTCFKMSGYIQYAAIGTGALAGVVAIIANKREGNSKDQLRLCVYALSGFAIGFELVSISYKIRGGRYLKLAANANGPSVSLNF